MTTSIFELRGWRCALVTGASNRTVSRRSPAGVLNAADERSQMMAFQSREALSRYRELRLQLCRPKRVSVCEIARWAGDGPERGNGLDVPLEPAHDALGFKVVHGYSAVQAADGEKVACEDAARVEARAEPSRLDGGLKVLGEALRERVCVVG